jgi:mono/diheme cytochrome c family protein
MKLRTTLFVALITLVLSACNFTLARDVTPPPGAIQQAQVQSTQGPVFPAQAPDLQNGASIYAQECTPCHGSQGLGDGSMSAQLASQNITVPALGSAETASTASPADWYLMVTQGNMQSFMPPFESKLSEQERWDVVAYALSLSTTSEQVSQGEQLFKKDCADCSTDSFTDQEKMAALSRADLVKMLSEGGDGIPALGDKLSQGELTAVAAYLQTLTLGAPSLAAEPASGTATPAPAQSGTPSAEGTPVEGTQQAGAAPEATLATSGAGLISGKVVNGSGGEVPAGTTVTLHGFEHSTDTSNTTPTPQEVVTETAKTDANGVYTFNDVAIPQGRIFLAEASYKGTIFQSGPVVVNAGASDLTVPDITVYDSTTDSSGLVVEQLHVSFDMTVDGGAQVFELFTISNSSDKAFVFSTDGSSLPFMPLPEGASNVGLELSQNSAPIMPTDSGDYALPPSQDFYSIIAFFNMPYNNSLDLTQPLALPVSSALVIVPEGIKVKSDVLTDGGVQQTQQGANVQVYTGSNLSAGSPLEMSLSGKAKAAATSSTGNNQTLLIGAGAFGIVLILAGVWMFMRDRDKVDEDSFEEADEDEDEFETAEEVMDAIIALDDLYRAKKIPEEAYQKRREELKERLKELA